MMSNEAEQFSQIKNNHKVQGESQEDLTITNETEYSHKIPRIQSLRDRLQAL